MRAKTTPICRKFAVLAHPHPNSTSNNSNLRQLRAKTTPICRKFPVGVGDDRGVTVPSVAADDAGAVRRVADVLRAGGVVVMPTDTVYGLAALPSMAAATRRIFELKGREQDVPLAVLCADTTQAAGLTTPAGAETVRALSRFWPGPLTVVLPRRDGLELHLGEPPDTVGVRVPALDFVRGLARAVGPVAATSANRHGLPTPAGALDAAASLVQPPDLVVDGGPAPGSASTVVDATVVPWRVLREGPLPAAAVLSVAPRR